jgi:hypothetical protein
VQLSMATSAGRAGRPNEDFVGALPGAVVLLDGAGIPGASALCSHGVAWYTHRLGGALLGGLSSDGGDLAAVLGAAISSVADSHRDTCDLAHPNSPQATVAIVRASSGRLDYLLLADSYLVLDGGEVLTDSREVAARRDCAAPLEGLVVGTSEYAWALDACRAEMRARRNQPGGYWIAKDDPRAAAEAVTGSRPLADLALLSNGASRIVDPYGVTDWPGVWELLRADGPGEVIRRVREAEAFSGAADPDDATVAYGDMSDHRG